MKIISHLVWDESEQRMVEIYGTEKYKFKTAAIFYHPWQVPKATPESERLDNEAGFGCWIKITPINKCTCGGKFVGDSHSDWCDSLKKVDEDELPF